MKPVRLYALCDQKILDQRGITLEAFVALCKHHNAEIIQYRNKSNDTDFITTQLKKLRILWDKTLIINDRLMLHSFCDGVHLGQEDLQKIDTDLDKAIKKIRMIIGEEKLLGISTHNETEIRSANHVDLDYIGLGAYRSTGTKEEAKVLGSRLDTLASLSKHPVAAIGGVKLTDVFEYVTYHVIASALLPAENEHL